MLVLENITPESVGFCKSHMRGVYDTNRLDCYQLSLGGERVQCPYSESHIQLRYVEGDPHNPQLYIPSPHKKGLDACDFIPTTETNSRLIPKLSQQSKPE